LLAAEEVEIGRLTMGEPQGDRRPAIERETRRDADQLRPKPPLRRGQHVETRLESLRHSSSCSADRKSNTSGA
jgi:hypothetical protein